MDRRPPRVAVRVGEDGDWTLGLCILKTEEEICGVGFMKGLRKTNKSEGRLRLDGATAVALDSSNREMRNCWVFPNRWIILYTRVTHLF